MLERIAPDIGAGSVVVMHDGMHDGRGERSQTVELVEPLIGNIRARGWEPGPLGDGRGAGLRWGRPVNSAVRARERLRTDTGAGRPVKVEVVDESDLSDDDMRGLSAVLAESMTRLGHEYAERPWRRMRPEFRIVARSEGSVLGQVAAFRIRTRPERHLYGLGDLAVAASARGRGVAAMLTEANRAECFRRGADILLSDTTAIKARLLRSGYAPVPRFRFWYERDGACHWHPHWIARIHHPEVRTRLELEEGDF
jgi:GNAT superfamily N-acetyltransferase